MPLTDEDRRKGQLVNKAKAEARRRFDAAFHEPFPRNAGSAEISEWFRNEFLWLAVEAKRPAEKSSNLWRAGVWAFRASQMSGASGLDIQREYQEHLQRMLEKQEEGAIDEQGFTNGTGSDTKSSLDPVESIEPEGSSVTADGNIEDQADSAERGGEAGTEPATQGEPALARTPEVVEPEDRAPKREWPDWAKLLPVVRPRAARV